MSLSSVYKYKEPYQLLLDLYYGACFYHLTGIAILLLLVEYILCMSKSELMGMGSINKYIRKL